MVLAGINPAGALPEQDCAILERMMPTDEVGRWMRSNPDQLATAERRPIIKSHPNDGHSFVRLPDVFNGVTRLT
jgi:hypothetical protein